MNESNKNYKERNQKTTYTRKLFKFSKDEDFFKSSSEDLSDSVSFKKKIKGSEENDKVSKEKKNILLINKRLKENVINSKGSTSSTNKIKNMYDGDKAIEDNNNKDKDKNAIYYEEIESSDFKENGKEENLKRSFNLNKNSKKLVLNDSIQVSNNQLLSSKDNLTQNENNSKNKDEDNEEENMNNIVNNYIDSSFKSYTNKSNILSNKGNSRNIQKDLNSNKDIRITSQNRMNNNDNNDNNESYFESESGFSKKKNNIINLKPLNIEVKTKNSKSKINTFNKKISIMQTNSEPKILKNEEISKYQRKGTKRITQREYSINSSNSTNEKDINKIENKIKVFISQYFINIPILFIMIIMNLFSLFSNDIRHLWVDKNADIYIDIINLIALLYFIIEIIILCLLDDTYLASFIFWIDLIGALFILFNVEFIIQKIFSKFIYNKSESQINISFEYLNICFIMLERVIRTAKILKCLKLYNILEAIKKYNKIYSEKMQRDFVKEENQKQKLMQKIQNINAESEIDESVNSNESFQQSKKSLSLNELKENFVQKEENDESKSVKSSVKKVPTITGIHPNEENKVERVVRIKRAATIKKITRIFRKGSLKSLRQYNTQLKNSTIGGEKLNNLNLKKKDNENEKNKNQIEEEIYKKIDESLNNAKITNKVKYSIRKKIIIIFIILLLICVLLKEELFLFFKVNENILSYSYIFDFLINCPFNNNTICEEKINNVLLIVKEDDFPIINITKNDILIYQNLNLSKNNFRYCELGKISSKNNNTNEIINIIYSLKRDNNIKHYLYLLLSIILCFSIILASILYETDLTNILLTPIEVMIEVADKVAKDPINAKNIEELEQGVIDILQKNKKENKNNIVNEEKIKKNYDECYNSYEVKAIMNAIIKISALLAMSVGDAGGEIIHKNLSSDLGIRLHSRGKKKLAIFGFCNIRNFEEINLALEEETVPLINKIAEIVHSSVDIFRGNTNKNMGDSFFNVWKFYNNINIKNNHDKRLKKDNLLEIDPTNPQVNITADCAVLAYLRCILKINKHLNILEYNKNKKLNKIIPKFKIRMGFGLHLGYGIEGVIGSTFKMEASYLSPNVNIAARLETATKQFGVYLLISGKLYDLFTEDMKDICRYVDCVRVKGSTEPIDLYTIDINENVSPQKKEKLKIIKTSEEKAKIFKEKKTMLECLIEEYGSIAPIILDRKSYLELIDEKSEKFYDSWEYAMDSYKKGKWKEAKKYFEECLEEDSSDGPTNTLYNYIKKFNFNSPQNWKGERELINK